MLQKIPQLIGRLSLRPFDTSTEDGRANERFRRIALTSATSVILRVVTVVSALISVPLTLHYLGAEQYGMWLTISSFIALLWFADLGMGNGLINVISKTDGSNDVDTAQRAVTAAFVMLTAIGLALGLVFLIAYPFIDWAGIFNVHTAEAKREAGPAMMVLFLGMALNMPTGVVQRVQIGYQEGFESNVWNCAGSLIALASLLFVIHLHATLPVLVFVFEVVPTVARIVNGIVYFVFQKPWLAPRLKYWSFEIGRQLLGTGMLFLILSVTSALSYTSDNLVIAHVLGAKSVAQYGITSRPFGMITSITMMVVMPMWPAYGEALARGDFAWIKRVLLRSINLSVLTTSIPAIAMVLCAKFIFGLWVGSSITMSYPLLIGLAGWSVIGTVGNCVAMFLNGTHVVKFQVYVAVPTSILTLLAKIFGARWLGLPGVVYATSAVYIVLTLIPYAVYVSKILNRKHPEPPGDVPDESRFEFEEVSG